MNSCYFLSIHIIFVVINADFRQIQQVDVQQNERTQLECILPSKSDVEGALWMRIRSPHNPDILTYRDNIVYAPDRLKLDQRHLTSNMNTNGTFIDTYFSTLIILRPDLDDEGRYICSKGRMIFAEYDLFIIVPSRFVEEKNFIPQQSVIEGSTLHLSCAAEGRPMPWITWFYRTNNNKLILLGDGTACRKTVCEISLGNYTRHDPTIIECIADNEKSSRISKLFHIDVLYPPKMITHLRTFIGSKSIDVLIECSSIANPSSTMSWFDDNQQELTNSHFYTIKTINQSSILSFSVFSNEHANVLYYCRSNNSIGTVEKLIDISDFIQFDNKPSTITISPSRMYKTGKPSRIRSKPLIITTISSTSSTFCYSTILYLFCNLYFINKNTIYCTV